MDEGPEPCSIAGTFSVANGCLSDEFRLFVDADDPYNPPNNPRYIYEYNIDADNTISGISSTDPRSVNVTYSTPGTKTITATVTDRNDPNCFITLTTSFVVTACGIEGPETCLVDIDISNTVCQDNGMFTFDLTVFRTAGAPGSSWEGSLFVDDTGLPLTGIYNQTITLGPFSILQESQINPFNSFRRTVGVAINAIGITDCSDFVEVLAPESCPVEPTGGINYCANVSVVGGPGQITISGIEAPNHRIQYRLFPSAPYTDICVNNCFTSQLIYGLPANTYYIRVEQSSVDGGDYCEQEFTVEVSRSLAESSSRVASFEVHHIRFGTGITSMDLYPNPAKQELYVNLTEYEGKEASVLIVNQYGKVVEEFQVAAISQEPMRIDLATYSNGLYFIRTKINKTKIITKKFLVNKPN